MEAFRGLAKRLPTAETDRAFGEARRVLARLVPELEPSDTVAGIDGPGTVAPGQLFELLLGVLHRLAARGPVVLAVEDLHWADRSTRDLLAFLVRNLRAGVVLVLTYRSDDMPRGHPLRPWLAELERTGRVHRIALARFTRPELAELLAGILGRAAPPHLITSVMNRSDGNAFYAEELAAAHHDGTAMSRTLREVLLARIEALSPPTRGLLRTVAVAGQRCDHDLLAQVADLSADDLVVAVGEATDHHLLLVDDAIAAGGYAFRHALLQEAVYRDLLPVQRSVLHAAYARALARRLDRRRSMGSDRATADELGLLANHWYAAQDLAHALPACIQAGWAAKAAAAPAEALEYFQRAATLWHQAPIDAVEGGLDRAALLEQAAEAAYLLSEHERAIGLAGQALAEIGDTDPPRTGTLLARTARYHRSLGDRARAAAVMGQALALIPDRPASPERAGALAAFARLLLTTGHLEEARRRSEQALAVARQVGARAEEGQALDTLGRIHLQLGQPAPAIACLREALDLAVRVGDAEEMCRASHNLTEALEADGRSAEAATVGLDGCRSARRHGLVRGYGTLNLVHTALLLLRLGRWYEGDELLDEVFQLDLPPLEMFPAVMARASGRLWRGALDATRADLAAAAANAAAGLSPEFAAITDALRAELAIWDGRFADASATVSHWLTASTDPLSPLAVLQLCTIGLRAEAAIVERAHRHGAVGEEELARLRAVRLLEHVSAAEPAGSVTPLPLVAAEAASAKAEWSRIVDVDDPAAWRDAATAWEQLAIVYPLAFSGGGTARPSDQIPPGPVLTGPQHPTTVDPCYVPYAPC